MATFLLTWSTNSKGDWRVTPEAVTATAAGQVLPEWWNVQSHKKIRQGDRVFLFKQGKEPRGVIGSGKVVSEVEDHPHFDDVRKARGETVKGVDIEFDRFVDPDTDILPSEKLQSHALARLNWNTQGSGIPIEEEAAAELEKLWEEWVAELPGTGARTSSDYGRGGGESPEHQNLKEKVRANPGLIGLRDVVCTAVAEYALKSGDEIDVFVEVSTSPRFHAIEIKLSDPKEIERGVYQAVKYRALVAAGEGLPLDSSEVVSHLVTKANLPRKVRDVAKQYGIRTHQLP